MKGPSIEAIRRFKEQQEQKKREEQDKKVQEKLSTLEHRAARGDKKAKHQLKQIEKIDEERNRRPTEDHRVSSSKSKNSRPAQSSSNERQKHQPTTSKTKRQGPDFEELMRLAASNKNEVKREEVKESKPIPKTRDIRPRPDAPKKDLPIKQPRPQPAVTIKTVESRPKQPQQRAPAPSHSQSRPRQQSLPNPRDLNHRRPYEKPAGYSQVRPRLPIRPNHHYRNASYYDEPEDDYEEDEYEDDGFVVDEDDDGVQDEVDKTIRSVFRYDKRRCELRERAIDREYRAIGRVSTFEDLEREERRASRLAAAEDAEAQREEEEHKRLKRQRLKQYRD